MVHVLVIVTRHKRLEINNYVKCNKMYVWVAYIFLRIPLCSVNIITIFSRSVAGMANFIPVLAWLPGDLFGVKKSLENADKIYEYCNEIIAEHLEYYDENNIDDLTSAYIKEMRRAEAAGELTSMSCKHAHINRLTKLLKNPTTIQRFVKVSEK